MNIFIEELANDIMLNVNSAKSVALKLNRDYDANDEKYRMEREFQEVLNQGSRDLVCTYFSLPIISREEIDRGLKVLAETIKLLEGSKYAEFQRGRIKNLEVIAKEAKLS